MSCDSDALTFLQSGLKDSQEKLNLASLVVKTETLNMQDEYFI